jgi:hypothetical protein
MTRAWRDLAIGVLGIIAAGFLLRVVSEPFRVDANRYRLERLEELTDQQERRILRQEVRHEMAPPGGHHSTIPRR